MLSFLIVKLTAIKCELAIHSSIHGPYGAFFHSSGKYLEKEFEHNSSYSRACPDCMGLYNIISINN